MNQADINLHIETLVLEGLPVSHREQVKAGVVTELTRLLSEQGLPPSFSQAQPMVQVDGGRFTVTPHAAPETLSAQIAAQIHQGLSR